MLYTFLFGMSVGFFTLLGTVLLIMCAYGFRQSYGKLSEIRNAQIIIGYIISASLFFGVIFVLTVSP